MIYDLVLLLFPHLHGAQAGIITFGVILIAPALILAYVLVELAFHSSISWVHRGRKKTATPVGDLLNRRADMPCISWPIALSLQFPLVAAIIGSCAALVYLARKVCDVKYVLSDHIENKSMHKGDSE